MTVTKVGTVLHKNVLMAPKDFPYGQDKTYVEGEGGKDIPEMVLHDGETEPIVRIETGDEAIEGFLNQMRRQRSNPLAHFYYHTYMFQRFSLTVEKIQPILDYARRKNLEVRAWANPESAMNLIAVKDPDTSEESGMELYEAMQDKYDSYGLASWYEFHEWGIPLDLNAEVRPGKSGTCLIFGDINSGVVIE